MSTDLQIMVYLEALRLPDIKLQIEVFHTWDRDFFSKDVQIVCKIKRMQAGTWKVSSLCLVFIVLKGVFHAPFQNRNLSAWPTSQAAGLFDTNTVLCTFH